jgi:hypothetical protein
MVTLRNSHDDSLDSKGEGYLLLDRLIILLTCNEHTTSSHDDMLKYVHEKPGCHNICEKGTDAKRASYKKCLRQTGWTTRKLLKGGKARAY